jgi:hypothetical protein
MIQPLMKSLLQQIGPDYYRFVQVLIARVQLEQLHQWRFDVEKRSKIPLGMSRVPGRSRADPYRNQEFSGGMTIEELRGPCARHPKGDGTGAALQKRIRPTPSSHIAT